jgi:hypothetical protein
LLYWSRPKPYYPSEYAAIDLGLREGELLTGMTSLNGKLIVLTNQRTFWLTEKQTPWAKSMYRKVKAIWQRLRRKHHQ